MSFFQINNIHLYIGIFLSVVNGAILCFSSSKFLQVLQQAGYEIRGYNMWLRGTRYKYVSRLLMLGLLSIACALVTNALFDAYHNQTIFSYLGLIFYFYFTGVFVHNLINEPNKMPLVKTNRINRMIGVLFVFYSIVTFVLIALSTEFFTLLRSGIITMTPILIPLFVIIVFYVLYPIEKLINNKYINKAKNKLKKLPNLITIGITGSFAKTTNKFFLKEMLSQKFKVIASPFSYNTPLGLTRVILGELKEDDEVLIAEMGAKKKGEIKDLCKLIKPNHGIITGVGSQHLETFKTVENIKDTKFELAEAVEGFMVFNGDSPLCKELYENYENDNKIITYGKNKNAFAYCSDITADAEGLKFILHIQDKKIECFTKLLGIYNLQNITMCASLSYQLGVSLEQIKKAIKNLSTVPHRMEIIKAENGSLIIDDSFNASVEGTKAAFETLALFEKRIQVIITPGIIEMGKLETKVNFELGAEIAKIFDYVIIVNEINAKALREGLESENFDSEKMFFVANLEEAKTKLTSLNLENPVVLFENDLPDLFNY